MSCRNTAEANLKTGHSLAQMWLKSGVAYWQQKCRKTDGFRGIMGISAAFLQPVPPQNRAA
jgi:hypothetical protein